MLDEIATAMERGQKALPTDKDVAKKVTPMLEQLLLALFGMNTPSGKQMVPMGRMMEALNPAALLGNKTPDTNELAWIEWAKKDFMQKQLLEEEMKRRQALGMGNQFNPGVVR